VARTDDTDLSSDSAGSADRLVGPRCFSLDTRGLTKGRALVTLDRLVSVSAVDGDGDAFMDFLMIGEQSEALVHLKEVLGG